MRDTIVIKDVDESAYRNLKGEAIKSGLRVGEAASQAFRLWIQQRARRRVKDTDRMKKAAEMMDRNRSLLKKAEEWSSVEVIRQWRELRRH
jgi:membrane-bound lytic murein transglycosylase B